MIKMMDLIWRFLMSALVTSAVLLVLVDAGVLEGQDVVSKSLNGSPQAGAYDYVSVDDPSEDETTLKMEPKVQTMESKTHAGNNRASITPASVVAIEDVGYVAYEEMSILALHIPLNGTENLEYMQRKLQRDRQKRQDPATAYVCYMIGSAFVMWHLWREKNRQEDKIIQMETELAKQNREIGELQDAMKNATKAVQGMQKATEYYRYKGVLRGMNSQKKLFKMLVANLNSSIIDSSTLECRKNQFPTSLWKEEAIILAISEFNRFLIGRNLSLAYNPEEISKFLRIPLLDCEVENGYMHIYMHMPVISTHRQWRIKRVSPLPVIVDNKICSLDMNTNLYGMSGSNVQFLESGDANSCDDTLKLCRMDADNVKFLSNYKCLESLSSSSYNGVVSKECKFVCHNPTSSITIRKWNITHSVVVNATSASIVCRQDTSEHKLEPGAYFFRRSCNCHYILDGNLRLGGPHLCGNTDGHFIYHVYATPSLYQNMSSWITPINGQVARINNQEYLPDFNPKEEHNEYTPNSNSKKSFWESLFDFENGTIVENIGKLILLAILGFACVKVAPDIIKSVKESMEATRELFSSFIPRRTAEASSSPA